jgi:hypothetical protein
MVLAEDDGHGEAVVAFAAYGLEGGGGEAGFGGDQVQELAGALDARIGVIGVEDGAVADDVVGEDEGAGAGEL